MNNKKVIITPGCITCGTCEFICPQVFEVTDVARVKRDAPTSSFEKDIEMAVRSCPVQVIKVKEQVDHDDGTD